MRKIIATIEARMTSSRLPGKVLMDLGGKPALEQMIKRVKRSQKIDDVVIATTTNFTDDPIVKLCEEIGCKFFRGDEHDVLKRVLDAAESFGATHIVELTGDCPLVDPAHVDKMIEFYFASHSDYVSNRLEKGLPDGFDVQVFSVENLKKIESLTQDPVDRSHVSCFFYKNPDKFKIGSLAPAESEVEFWPDLALTLDEPLDYEFLKKIFDQIGANTSALSAKEIIAFLRKNPELLEINKKVMRKELNEG